MCTEGLRHTCLTRVVIRVQETCSPSRKCIVHNLAVVMCLSGSPGWFSRNIRYLSIDIVAPKVE